MICESDCLFDLNPRVRSYLNVARSDCLEKESMLIVIVYGLFPCYNQTFIYHFQMLPEMKVYHQSNVGKKGSFTFLFELFLKNLFSWDRDLLLVSGSSLQI